MQRKRNKCRGRSSFVFLFFLALAALSKLGLAQAGPPALSINDLALDESSCESPKFVFTVTLSHLGKQPVTVSYATSDGSPSGLGTAAVAGKDYAAASGTLTFDHLTPPNGSHGIFLETITVPLGNYVATSGSNVGRAFTVTLSGATNATISKAQGVGTLLNAAVSCEPSQNAQCFVNFCGANAACKNVNRSAIATPFAVLAGVNGPPDPDFSACNAAGLWRDSDGDGLSDAAESQGYIDVNANGVFDPGIDVALPGADPNKPDLYLHYDYVAAADHDHNPPAEAIHWIVDSFAAHNIALHIDPLHVAIDESGAKVVTLQNPPNPSCTGPSAVSTAQLRKKYLSDPLKLAYHYMVFGHWSTCNSAVDCNNCPVDPECGGGNPPVFGSVGSAEIFGSDAVVSFGVFVDAAVPIPLESTAGVAMHELGHNLGLFHGGGNCDNFKPNYLSVMSYGFYLTGIPVGAMAGDTVPKSCSSDQDCPANAHCSAAGNGAFPRACVRIDYSGQKLPDLNETNLTERAGLNASPISTDISVFTVDGITPIYIPTNGSPVDWNQDGNAAESGVQQDVNGDGATTLLTGFNDWANLKFAFQVSSTPQEPKSSASTNNLTATYPK